MPLDLYDPTINFQTLTLGDVFAMVSLTIVVTIISAIFYFAYGQRILIPHEAPSILEPPTPPKHSKVLNIKDLLLLDIEEHLKLRNATKGGPIIVADDENEEKHPIDISQHLNEVNEPNPINDSRIALKSMSASNTFRRDSVSGTVQSTSCCNAFITTLVLMIIAGSSNDFLGKLLYQMYPGNNGTLNGLHALKQEYWLTFSLTFASFFVCVFALFTKSARPSFAKMNTKLFLKISVPSIMDTLITGGRYLGLVFLSAALTSILKNGSQLFFLALIRRCLHQKRLLSVEWLGITVIIIGLFIIAMNKIYTALFDSDSELSAKDSTIGIIIMVSVGFAGAIRNDIEERLVKNDNLDSNFVVGIESAISLTFTMILGITLFMIDPFDNIDKENAFMNVYTDIILETPVFVVCFVLFCVAIFLKDTMQMKMTVLSSSLTRKLFQQIYPSGTWLISLTAFGINNAYGEGWEGMYSWIRLGGFFIVAMGNYFYIKGHSIFGYLSSFRLK